MDEAREAVLSAPRGVGTDSEVVRAGIWLAVHQGLAPGEAHALENLGRPMVLNV